MNFIEEENNQTMSARNKFPSYPSTATTADLSLGLSSSSEETLVEKEHMFDKVVTPSDVGKLNRLVIPKQHAERYFPLDSTANEKGLLLNFEDPNGKPWRFRYSYWNSSQSYVMTKGWSRFVKDKKLDAGDVVSFHRGLGQGKDRLFIDHRRRRETGSPDFQNRRAERPYPPLGGYFSFDNYRSYPYHHHQQQQQWSYKTLGPSRDHGLYWHNNYQHRHQYHQPWHGYGGSSCNNNNNNNSNSPGGSGPWARIDPLPTNLNTIIPSEQAFSSSHLTYLRSPAIQATHEPVYESVPIVVKGTNKSEKKKRLRLFGVNMEESGEELRVVSSSSSLFVNKGKSSSFDLDI